MTTSELTVWFVLGGTAAVLATYAGLLVHGVYTHYKYSGSR